ncbi:hypothetical protein F7725_017846 [Dissostichus mawsoni]|uniref:Uncharacterized protein n=1 Tax=Dissostichus mawsoni TaxID=36200 RepID=A0A7J5XRD6_DISMA|nr:hypothetical protein F7725_017846 [Dissostichus mawsoni]
MMQNYRLSPTFSMPVTVPVSNQNTALQFSNNPGGALVTTTSFLTSALTDPRLLSPQQPTLHRNTVSPGLPQRPASAGALLGDMGNSNGACPSPVRKKVTVLCVLPPPPRAVQTEEELELNAQRLGVSQSLTTPVVSVATPSLLAPFSGMQTAYNTEYQLTSADLTALQTFTPSMAAWQQQPVVSQQQQQQQQQHQQQQQQQQQQSSQMSLASLSNLVMWGAEKQNAEMVNCISNFAANLSLASQSNLLFGREDGLCWYYRPCQAKGDGELGIRKNPVDAVKGAVQRQQLHPQLHLRRRRRNGRRSRPDSAPGTGSSFGGVPGYPSSGGRRSGTLASRQPQQQRQFVRWQRSGRREPGKRRRSDRFPPPGRRRGQQQPTMVLLRPSSAEPQEQDGTNVKRMRLDTWVT